MNLPEPDLTFLRDLVKRSRQMHHHVEWVDRDGSKRVTTVGATEAARLNALAHHLGVSKAEVMRQVAFLPAAK